MVYVLIPAHNGKHEVLALLACLEQQTFRDKTVVLVDDGSTDGTEDAVMRAFPQVALLKGDGNLWWTGANAIGVRRILETAQPNDYVLLMNNELIVKTDFISDMVACSENMHRAIVGATTVDFHDPNRCLAGLYLDKRLRVKETTDPRAIAGTECEPHVDVLPGRGTLIPVEVFKKIGNFNATRLPHYGGDYEFTIRARRAGFQLVTSHRARVYAKLNITGLHIPDRERLSFRECIDLLFSRKSTANLYYYLTYVWMCSDEGYKVRNLATHGTGLIMDILGRTRLGHPMAAAVRFSLKRVRHMKEPCGS